MNLFFSTKSSQRSTLWKKMSDAEGNEAEEDFFQRQLFCQINGIITHIIRLPFNNFIR